MFYLSASSRHKFACLLSLMVLMQMTVALDCAEDQYEGNSFLIFDKCKDCPEGCAKCYKANLFLGIITTIKCSSCKYGYQIDGSDCVSLCPKESTFYWDNSTQTCQNITMAVESSDLGCIEASASAKINSGVALNPVYKLQWNVSSSNWKNIPSTFINAVNDVFVNATQKQLFSLTIPKEVAALLYNVSVNLDVIFSVRTSLSPNYAEIKQNFLLIPGPYPQVVTNVSELAIYRNKSAIPPLNVYYPFCGQIAYNFPAYLNEVSKFECYLYDIEAGKVLQQLQSMCYIPAYTLETLKSYKLLITFQAFNYAPQNTSLIVSIFYETPTCQWNYPQPLYLNGSNTISINPNVTISSKKQVYTWEAWEVGGISNVGVPGKPLGQVEWMLLYNRVDIPLRQSNNNYIRPPNSEAKNIHTKLSLIIREEAMNGETLNVCNLYFKVFYNTPVRDMKMWIEPKLTKTITDPLNPQFWCNQNSDFPAYFNYTWSVKRGSNLITLNSNNTKQDVNFVTFGYDVFQNITDNYTISCTARLYSQGILYIESSVDYYYIYKF